MMIFCQAMMLLEIVHAATGLVKGGIFPIFLQVQLHVLIVLTQYTYVPHSLLYI